MQCETNRIERERLVKAMHPESWTEESMMEMFTQEVYKDSQVLYKDKAPRK